MNQRATERPQQDRRRTRMALASTCASAPNCSVTSGISTWRDGSSPTCCSWPSAPIQKTDAAPRASRTSRGRLSTMKNVAGSSIARVAAAALSAATGASSAGESSEGRSAYTNGRNVEPEYQRGLESRCAATNHVCVLVTRWHDDRSSHSVGVEWRSHGPSWTTPVQWTVRILSSQGD